jgi:hypothetical protein
MTIEPITSINENPACKHTSYKTASPSLVGAVLRPRMLAFNQYIQSMQPIAVRTPLPQGQAR